MLRVAVMNVPVNETFANLADDYIGTNWPPYSPLPGNGRVAVDDQDVVLGSERLMGGR